MAPPPERPRDDQPSKPNTGGADAVPDTVQSSGKPASGEERRKTPRGAPPAEESGGKSILSATWIIAIIALLVVLALVFGVLG